MSAYLLETETDQVGLLRALAMGVGSKEQSAFSRFIAAGRKGGDMGPAVASFADEVSSLLRVSLPFPIHSMPLLPTRSCAASTSCLA